MPATHARLRPGSLHRDTAPLDQRLALRFPRLDELVGNAILRLPLRFEGGLVVWQSWHRERDDALRAVGVDPARVVRPPRS